MKDQDAKENVWNNYIYLNGDDMDAKKIKLAVTIIIVLILAYFIVHLFKKSQPMTLPPVKVVVQQPQLKEITEYVTQTGNLVAYNSVDLVARVEGYLDSVEFEDGSFIQKGKELFVIQPNTYMEQLKAAQAAVAAQKSGYEYDKAEYARQQRMYKQNATSLNSVQKWLAKTQQSEAEIAQAVANEQVSAITYGYTHVYAPFDGRIGRHLVDPGNLVGNGVATKLATIEQIDPIYVYFNLNELDLLKLRQAARENGLTAKDINKIPVYVKLQNESDFQHKGSLDYVNTGLNASTGTLEFRGIFSNPDYILLPGLFVQVRIPVSQAAKKLTVPDTALLYDQQGAYVLTVDDKNIVQLQRVEAGTAEAGARPVKGLNAKDRVIISGLQFATPGNVVEPQPAKVQS